MAQRDDYQLCARCESEELFWQLDNYGLCPDGCSDYIARCDGCREICLTKNLDELGRCESCAPRMEVRA